MHMKGYHQFSSMAAQERLMYRVIQCISSGSVILFSVGGNITFPGSQYWQPDFSSTEKPGYFMKYINQDKLIKSVVWRKIGRGYCSRSSTGAKVPLHPRQLKEHLKNAGQLIKAKQCYNINMAQLKYCALRYELRCYMLVSRTKLQGGTTHQSAQKPDKLFNDKMNTNNILYNILALLGSSLHH